MSNYYFKNTYKIASNRLAGYDYSSQGGYFITICTKNRTCLFGDIVQEEMKLNEFGKIVHKEFLLIENYLEETYIDTFIVMPDHVHIIIIINNARRENSGILSTTKTNKNERKNRRNMIIPKIIGKCKMQTAKKINAMRNTSGESVRQKDYYDHIIRNENELDKIRKYIIENPLKRDVEKNNRED